MCPNHMVKLTMPFTINDNLISDIAYDSRKVKPGSAFVAIPGEKADGRDFAAAARAAGATVIITEKRIEGDTGPQILVRDARKALAEMSARLFGNPSAAFNLAGITGTNGKTTTAYMLDSIYQAAGLKSGMLGTVEYRVAGRNIPVTRTTPESYDLQKIFAEMKEAGVECAAMEVSSHAIDQKRVAAVQFGVKIFTNLSRDHLDYHGDMETYFTVKKTFMKIGKAPVVVNADDSFGRRLIAEMPGAITFGIDKPAAYRAKKIETTIMGGTFTVAAPGGQFALRIHQPGLFNIQNALAATAAAEIQGISREHIAAGFDALKNVPGRFERADSPKGFTVVVDYAHTPDSVEKAVKSAKALAEGRVITVLGCGGDRDRGKRPLMGKAAADLSDITVITSDNPRSEDPAAIIADIRAGVGGKHVEIIDRREAIKQAITMARPGDIVLIAGKGHEKEQIFKDKTIEFDDLKVAKEAIEGAGT